MRLATSTVIAAMFSRAAVAQKPPAVHLLDRPSATSKREFNGIAAVRQLPNGNVLVNDGSRRLLLMLDSSLNTVRVVADSVAGSTNPYDAAFGGLIPFRGDSSLFILPRVPSMYLIDPTGAIARVLSVPRPQDVYAMAYPSSSGVPGIDAKGRWVYRGSTPPAPRPTLVAGGPPVWMIGPDSAPIVRYDPTTHTLDTISKYKFTQLKAKMYPQDNGGSRAVIQRNPVDVLDDWAVLADGSVAIVRGHDYHIDFVNADGSVVRGPKMAFDWEPLGDDAKIALLDSLRKADEDSRKTAGPTTAITGAGPGGGRASGGSASTGASSGGASLAPGSPSGFRPPAEFPSVSDLPDYRPPFGQNALRPDAVGNVWVKTTHHESRPGFVYDVINRQGKVIDRVQLPPGRTIIGFGRGGIVYMVAGADESTSALEKSKWLAP
jgi:hypothetical protein